MGCVTSKTLVEGCGLNKRGQLYKFYPLVHSSRSRIGDISMHVTTTIDRNSSVSNHLFTCPSVSSLDDNDHLSIDQRQSVTFVSSLAKKVIHNGNSNNDNNQVILGKDCEREFVVGDHDNGDEDEPIVEAESARISHSPSFKVYIRALDTNDYLNYGSNGETKLEDLIEINRDLLVGDSACSIEQVIMQLQNEEHITAVTSFSTQGGMTKSVEKSKKGKRFSRIIP